LLGGWLAGPIIAALVAAIVAVQVVRDRAYPQSSVSDRLMYVQSGQALKRIVLSFDALAADVYWIRAIQHFGSERLSAEAPNYDLLYPLLDLTTTLDPKFSVAYRFGSIFLSETYPGGAGRPDLAIKLLEKGIREDGRWQFFHDIAFVHYWHRRDFKTAAEWFQKAAEQPNAPNWLPPLAAGILTAGNDRASARFLWTEILKSEEKWLRDNATRSLRQLDTLDLIDQLQPVVNRYPPPAGQKYSWDALVRGRVLRLVPFDATGTPLDLDPESGAITVSKSSSLWPMPSLPK
jgi:hypothetical protein